jgi:endonuclease/exonuclease/phosphatase family metal-dependent hydrolase
MAFVFFTAACEENKGTPSWENGGSQLNDVDELPPKRVIEIKPGVSAPDVGSNTASFRFLAYNVENWLTMERFGEKNLRETGPKPDSEKSAVIKLLADHSPDVLGLCEIGTAADLAELQQMLKNAGVNMPHSHYCGGSDAVRHLGLLSRYAITSTSKPAETDFRLHGKMHSINRGILDVTVAIHGRPYRFIGAHLKSKRELEDFDQAEMRLHEARLLRRHVDAILGKDPQARLVVYGDFNDTRATKTIKTITGSYNDPGYLTAIPLRDSRGHAWTHHWATHDIYSRIDFITVSQALRREVDFKSSYIIDDPGWEQASDHRPAVAIFR